MRESADASLDACEHGSYSTSLLILSSGYQYYLNAARIAHGSLGEWFEAMRTNAVLPTGIASLSVLENAKEISLCDSGRGL
jgi:hypothetical protein